MSETQIGYGFPALNVVKGGAVFVYRKARRVRRHFLPLALVLVLLTGCTRVDMAGNVLISSGQVIRGSLVAPSANVTLEQGSRVTRSLVVLCCNVIVDGQVDRHVIVLSGNIILGPQARVGGDVLYASGNLIRSPGSEVNGTISSGLGARIAVAALGLFCLVFVAFGVLVLLIALFIRNKRRVRPSL
jgi:hypothetical protein